MLFIEPLVDIAMGITSIMLAVGAIVKNVRLISPNLVCFYIYLVLNCTAAATTFIHHYNNPLIYGYIFANIIGIYIWLCIYSFYQELCNEEAESTQVQEEVTQ